MSSYIIFAFVFFCIFMVIKSGIKVNVYMNDILNILKKEGKIKNKNELVAFLRKRDSYGFSGSKKRIARKLIHQDDSNEYKEKMYLYIKFNVEMTNWLWVLFITNILYRLFDYFV